ncbi:hypothetical protein CDO26_18835 (plasmid) [Sinorhizobium meliloti]|nr:hypothetical protein CDO26_18835 [Sinorhizobium meliloti]MQW29659.1 hypothetical protein [Sinorhizobium meliloti]RVJ55349.1 hypothetical protein CN175_08220 [Sinorhizobium meliloti]RVJ73053.1 hypothetical protein CN171_15845 [Sinorhizobium meliloti]RVJ94965.1 hypothetical protein CN169_08860 [Sinorhizobium meliloti]
MAADQLSTYKKKRDFKQTQEPSGAAAVKPTNRLHFIIQKHDATRFHYDLRPELDGVFKSWAVTTKCSPLPPVVLRKLDAARRSARKSLSWAEAKGFAHDVCQEMARGNPDLYLIKMTKSLRECRIFLDYLRNDRMATAVAPLSPRARPGANVSMPLTWKQVQSNLDPKRFTVRTVPALRAKASAWEEYCDGQRPLEQAIKRLGKHKAAA